MISATKPIKILFFTIITLFSFVPFTNAQDHNSENNEDIQTNHEEKEFNASELINEHIGDSHDFHIADWNGHAISMPLPVILWSKNGIVTFMSSKFHHDNNGEVVVENNGEKFVRIHEQIYQINEGENALILGDELVPTNASRPLDFSITKNVFSMLMSAIIIFLLFSAVARSYKKNKNAPKGIAGFLEPLVTFVRDDIALPNIGEKKYERYMPYLLTVFFFVWINNLIGLVPFFPGSSNLTGNIVFTGVLAFITFIITTFSGNKNYWSHILMPPVPKALYPIMIPVEIIGMLTKPFALMIRLFANITAGHIIILSLVSLIFIFKTVAIAPVSAVFVLFMSVLELLVAALQAYIFTLLSALFIGQAVAEDHH
ncbi:F0F1 ATP synthase subunit A [uncultured Lutibacter sp.]|uniref:F0F1 ATP synthase subunit A n=1 Tax=uncultured Lutibacter sp. TaxID=437739 RepID=UPI00260B399C|nr:F0F1 ATP synthase subunit A [uncultured Lutibacter sp.]